MNDAQKREALEGLLRDLTICSGGGGPVVLGQDEAELLLKVLERMALAANLAPEGDHAPIF